MRINRIHPDVTVLADSLQVPGQGHLPINAFVLHAAEPVVVDTGLSLPDRDFLDTLGSVIDPADVAWIWLTHPDRDHTGGLHALLDAAPHARLVTTFGALGILSCARPVPPDRVYLLNPGQSIDVGDRRLTAFRPPLFDNPTTVGLFDDRSGTCFTSDCFGAPVSESEQALADDAAVIPASDLRAAQLLWASIDSPWVQLVDPSKYFPTVAALRDFGAARLLSTHLPPIANVDDAVFTLLADAPDAPEFPAPDQHALEMMLAQLEPTGAGALPS